MAREVRVSLVIDDHGSVKVLRSTADEGDKTASKLDHLDKGVKELGKSFGGLKGLVGMGLGALGAGSLVFGLKDIASKTGEIAEETHKFSSITGFGTNTSLRYTAALKARGITADQGGRMFAFLAKNLQTAERQHYMFAVSQEKAAAKGKQTTSLLGIQATAFQKLGINLQQFHALSEEAKFDLVIKKMEGLKAGMEKTAISKELFGRGGAEMLPMLQGGALGFSHMTEMAKKFFPTIKGEGKQAMEELLVKQTESKMAWEGLEFTMGEKLVPAMTTVDTWFSKLAASIEHGRGVWGSLEKNVGFAVHEFEDAYNWLSKDKTAIEILGFALAGLAGVWGVSKILDFVAALGKLSAVRGLSSMVGAEAAGESAAFGVAGGTLGAALALGFGAALVPGMAKAIKEAVELLHPGSLKQHSVAEDMEIMLYGKTKAHPQKKEDRAGLAHPEAGGLSPRDRARRHAEWAAGARTMVRREREITLGGTEYRGQEHELIHNPALTRQLTPSLAAHLPEYLQVHTHVNLDSRQIVEAIERYSLKRAARR